MKQGFFIAGCGYIGERITRILRDSGANVRCMTRSIERGERLRSEGFDTQIVSLDDSTLMPTLDLAGHVIFYLVPPPGGGFSDPRARNFLNTLEHSNAPLKIIYISATSVYSAKDGSVVTEESPTQPVSAMGKRRLDAENAFRDYGFRHGVPVVILRVSGIYGPGRLPLTQINQGQPLLRREESGPSNRIHADDLARICVAAAEKGEAGEIFNVSDGHPSSMTDYFNAVADALGMPRPPQVSLEEAHRVMSPLMLAYASESRIVDSSRMLQRLGVSLHYPSIEDGLKVSL